MLHDILGKKAGGGIKLVLPINDLKVISKAENRNLAMQYFNKFGKAAPPYNPETYGTAEVYIEKLKKWIEADKPIN